MTLYLGVCPIVVTDSHTAALAGEWVESMVRLLRSAMT